jgi:hypothetical protein
MPEAKEKAPRPEPRGIEIRRRAAQPPNGLNLPVRAPPCNGPPPWCGVICGVCGVVKMVCVTQPNAPLATHAGVVVGHTPSVIWLVMHGWQEIIATCVTHRCGMQVCATVGHGWHEIGGICVWHGVKCDGQPAGVVVGHGWHEIGGNCVWHGT